MGVLQDTFKEPMFLKTLLLAGVIVLAVLYMQQQPSGNLIQPSQQEQKLTAPSFTLKKGVDYHAEIVTDYGTITVDLLEDVAPLNVNNFIYLTRKGYYKGLYWHRIAKDILIQSGDPTGTGKGSTGYFIKDEINSKTPKMAPGIVAMASFGKDKNSGQFFIVASKAPKQLLAEWDGKYTVIGKVIKGQDVVDKIASIGSDKSGKPREKVRIIRISIIERAK